MQENDLGFECYKKGDVEGAIKHFRVAAQAGLTLAKHNLACNLYPAKAEEAIKWWIEAAKEGHGNSFYYLGKILEEQNNVLAVICMQHAITLGSGNAKKWFDENELPLLWETALASDINEIFDPSLYKTS